MTFDTFNVTDAMKEKGISKMGIQADKFLVVIYNDISIKVDYNKEDWFETTQRFESAAAAYIVDNLFIQEIVSELTLNWYGRQNANSNAKRKRRQTNISARGQAEAYRYLDHSWKDSYRLRDVCH